MSIMLYFYPANLTKNNKGTHQNLKMSALDVIWLNKMYPGSKITPQNFYKEAYGENIDKELALSAKQNAQDIVGSTTSDNNKKPQSKTGIYIGIAILIIIIIVVLYSF